MLSRITTMFLMCLVLMYLAACTSTPVGPVVTDADGNKYRKVQTTTEWMALCNGSCASKQ